jgi:predicted ATPase/transcriptional regulator with XRE-family HTH domain
MESASRLHFGTLLRQFRLDAGLTQQQLAERAKLSVEAIGMLERGVRTRPYRETVLLLARALELSPEREALLESSIRVAHSPRRREPVDALKPSLLTIVRPDTQTTPRHNLPHLVTSFVGRQKEVGEVTALLREHRLVTVVGTGGVGKTRIAVQLGSELLDSSPDGVWLVDLAPLADQTLVASAILSALQLPSAIGSPSDVVIAYLKTRRLLLILDNCEHVISAVREVAASIVQSCPYVRILMTSREALDAPAERVYRLPSMAVPPDSREGAQDALRYGAVILFVDRAQAVNSTFALVDDNALDVIEICRRLDGIPLAIELAAARARVLAPRQIAERLDRRFRLLTDAEHRALPRHQTMTALIDWSYDLLTAREQEVFEELSVFSGGCTLESATAVCSRENEDDIDVLGFIESLVIKSLLVAELVGSEQRYHLLESSRQYARDKLIARGEQERLLRRHALIYLDLAERFDRAWDTTREPAWLSRAKAELGNWRAALEWALATRGDIIAGQRLAAVLTVVWRGFTLAEGQRWLRMALDLVDELTPPDLVARLEYAEAARAAQFGERNVSLAAAGRALVRYQELGDVLGVAHAQHLAGSSLAYLGRSAEAEALLLEALAAARSLGNRRLEADVLQKIGWARSAVGDFAGARAYLTEALGLARVLGAESFAGSVTISLADNEFDADDPEKALRLTVDLLATPALDSQNIAFALVNMAAYLIALRQYDEARARASEGFELARGLRMVALVAVSLQHLALVAVLRPQAEGRGNSTGAARLFGFVEARRTELGISLDYGLRQEYNRALAVLRDAIGTDELTHLMIAGASMTEDEAVAQAYALD